MRAEFENRPLLLASLALIAGVSTIEHPSHVLFFVALLVLFTSLRLRLFIAVAFLIGAAIGPEMPGLLTKAQGFRGEVRVVSPVAATAYGKSCEVRSGLFVYKASISGKAGISAGDLLYVKGTLRPLHGDYGQQMANQGISATLSISAADVRILERGPFQANFAEQLRDSLLGYVRANAPPTQSDIICSTTVGTGFYDKQAERLFSRAGAIHFMSASGIQVALLAAMVFFGLSLLPIPRSAQAVIVAIVLLLYAEATGMRPSTLRAVIGCVVFFSAYLVRRNPDSLSALGFAAIVGVLLWPAAIYAPGFQLSFVAVLALALYARAYPIPSKPKRVDKVASRVWWMIWASVVATLAVLPIIASLSGEISLVAVITALLLAPVVPLLILATFLAWSLSPISPVLAAGLMHGIALPIASYMLRVADILGSPGWATLGLPNMSGYWCVPYYAAWLLLWKRGGR